MLNMTDIMLAKGAPHKGPPLKGPGGACGGGACGVIELLSHVSLFTIATLSSHFFLGTIGPFEVACFELGIYISDKCVSGVKYFVMKS